MKNYVLSGILIRTPDSITVVDTGLLQPVDTEGLR